jgi:hypothetical protein
VPVEVRIGISRDQRNTATGLSTRTPGNPRAVLVPRGRSVRLLAVGALTLVGAVSASACADPRTAVVQAVTRSFATELASGDFASACALLTPATRERVERAGSCPAVLAQHPPVETGAELTSQVWGDRAQVRTETDTLFLVETSAGWKVAAAGCQPRGEAPYDCQLEGP